MRPFTKLRFSDRAVGIINFDPSNSFDISSATHSFIKGYLDLQHIFILVISPMFSIIFQGFGEIFFCGITTTVPYILGELRYHTCTIISCVL